MLTETRISKFEWALKLADVTALRATCLRRLVGCVLLDARGQVLATGYNGVASGQAHCNLIQADDGSWPHACPGAKAATGTQLEVCQAIHAEQNALLQCSDVQAIAGCFVTASPCLHCVKMLLNTSCRVIVFRERYKSHHDTAMAWWEASRGQGTWVQLEEST